MTPRPRSGTLALTFVMGFSAASARGEKLAPYAEAAPHPRETRGLVAKRVVAEVMMGLGVATVGYLAAPSVGGLGCADCIRAASLAGASAAFPVGVFWGGHMVLGNGSFWATVAAPWAVSATTVVALARDRSADGKPAFQIATWGSALAAPVSILAFELTNALSDASGRTAVSVVPTAGGMEVMLSVQHF